MIVSLCLVALLDISGAMYYTDVRDTEEIQSVELDLREEMFINSFGFEWGEEL